MKCWLPMRNGWKEESVAGARMTGLTQPSWPGWVVLDPKSLYPIQHRSTEVREDLLVIRVRDSLVESRTKSIRRCAGMVKTLGARVQGCSSVSFSGKAADQIPPAVQETLQPLLRLIQTLSEEIKSYEKPIEKLGSEKYMDTKLLRQVNGVGPVTSLAYVLTLETPQRFKRSRDVGPYLGLVPQQEDSGDSPAAAGHQQGRRQDAAQTAGGQRPLPSSGPFGPDTDLRRFGMKLCERAGGKNAKKRASVAVARKLAVLLHRLC